MYIHNKLTSDKQMTMRHIYMHKYESYIYVHITD